MYDPDGRSMKDYQTLVDLLGPFAFALDKVLTINQSNLPGIHEIKESNVKRTSDLFRGLSLSENELNDYQ